MVGRRAAAAKFPVSRASRRVRDGSPLARDPRRRQRQSQRQNCTRLGRPPAGMRCLDTHESQLSSSPRRHRFQISSLGVSVVGGPAGRRASYCAVDTSGWGESRRQFMLSASREAPLVRRENRTSSPDFSWEDVSTVAAARRSRRALVAARRSSLWPVGRPRPVTCDWTDRVYLIAPDAAKLRKRVGSPIGDQSRRHLK